VTLLGGMASPAMSASRPLSPVALDIVELWVADLARMQRTLIAGLGFAALEIDHPASEPGGRVRLGCGGVEIVLRHDPSGASPVGRHVESHGDTVADVALHAVDADAMAERAAAHGLYVSGSSGAWAIDMTGDGTVRHSLRRKEAARHPEVVSAGPRMLGIDHVAYCVPSGTAASLAQAYEDVFGLHRVAVPCEQVGGDIVGMRSMVLRSDLGFTVVLTEPSCPGGAGQTQRFIDAHRGPGVQHIALSYDDLVGAATAVRSRGLPLLEVPDEWLHRAEERLGGVALPWDELRQCGVLVDADGDGLILQVFTRPLGDRATFFVELIERRGGTGFGAGNVAALFAAVDAATAPLGRVAGTGASDGRHVESD